MTSTGAASTPASRSETEGAPDSARPKLGAKALRPQLFPLTEIRRVWIEALIWNDNEAMILSVLCVLANNETCTVNCKKRRERYNVDYLARASRMARNTFFRTFEVLEKKAGVVTRVVDPIPGKKANDFTQYVLHPDQLERWASQKRPVDWDRPRKPPGGVVPRWDYPPCADEVEAARARAQLPRDDAVVTRLADAAEKVDRADEKLSRAEIRHQDAGPRLAARRQVLEAERATVRAELVALAPPEVEAPPTAPAPAAPAVEFALTPVPPAVELAPAGPVLEGELLDGTEDDRASPDGLMTPVQREAFDGEVAFFLCRAPLLWPISGRRAAAAIGMSARRAGTTLEQAGVALDRLAFKVWRGDYPNLGQLDLLRLARAFVKRQWDRSADAPVPDILSQIPLPPALPEPTSDDIAAMHDHFGLTDGRLAELRIEHEERVRARAHFERALGVARATSPATFDKWFAQVQFEALAGNVLSLVAANDFVRDWVARDFLPALLAELSAAIGASVDVTWLPARRDLDEPIVAPAHPAAAPPRRPRR
jgi:hypothetical protein